jgi:hypothetical protein
LLGERFLQNLGRIAPRDREAVFGFDVIASSEATLTVIASEAKQSISPA